MSWYSLQIPLPANAKGNFRSALAAGSTASGWRVDPVVFHHDDQGETLNSSFPGFRVGQQGRNGVIYAVGAEECAYLAGNGHLISEIVQRQYNLQQIRDYRQGGGYSVASKHPGRLWKYILPTMVFQKKKADYEQYGQECKQYGKAKTELNKTVHKRIKGIIRRDILLHCDYMGVPVDEDFTLGDVAVERFVPVRVHGGRYFLAAVGVTFKTSLALVGVYHLGYLKARGKGRVVSLNGRGGGNA